MFIYIKDINVKDKKSNNLLDFLKETLGNGINISEFKDIITAKRVNKRELKISKIKDGGYNINNGYMDYGLFKDYNAIASRILTDLFSSIVPLSYEGEDKKEYFNKNINFLDYGFTYVKIPEDDLFGVEFKSKDKYLSEGLSKKEIVDLYNKELNFREDNIKLSDLFTNSDAYKDVFFEEGLSKKVRLMFGRRLTNDDAFIDLFPEVNIHNIFKYLLFKRKKIDKREVSRFEKAFTKVTSYKFVNYPIFFPEQLELISFIWGNMKISIIKEGNSFTINFLHKDFPEKIIKSEKNFKFLVIALNYIKDFFIENFTSRNIPKGLTLKDLKLNKRDKINTGLSMLIGEDRLFFTNIVMPIDFVNKNGENIKTWKDISDNGNDVVIPEYYTLENLIGGKLSAFLPISVNIERFTYLFNDAERLYSIRGIISWRQMINKATSIVFLGKVGEKKEIAIYFGEKKDETIYILFDTNDINEKKELYKDKYLDNIFKYLSKTKNTNIVENKLDEVKEIINKKSEGKTLMDYLKGKVVGNVETGLEEKIKELGLDYDFFEALTKPMIIKLQNSDGVYYSWLRNNKVKIEERLLLIKLKKLKEYGYFDEANTKEENVVNLSKYIQLTDNEKNLILTSNQNIKHILKDRGYGVDGYLQRVCQSNNNILLNTIFEGFKGKIKIPNKDIDINKVKDTLFGNPENYILFERNFKFEYNIGSIEKLLKKYNIDYEVLNELTYNEITENILISILLNAGENFFEISQGSIFFRGIKKKFFGDEYEKISQFIINIIKEIGILRRNIETYYISESDENKGAFIDKIDGSNINPKDLLITNLFKKVEIDSGTTIVRKGEKLVTIREDGVEVEGADYELIKGKWGEQIGDFLTTLNSKFTLKDKTLRIRGIARYKALGLYGPSSRTLIIDVWKGYKSFIHEFGHLIDFELGGIEGVSSKNRDFLDNIYSKQVLLMKDFIYNKMDKKSDEYLSLVGKNKFNLDYYLTYTEVFARMFEVYIVLKFGEKYNEIGRIIGDEKIEGFDYTRDVGLEKEILKFYDSILK